MHFVYILYSSKIDRYYVGQTYDVQARLVKHNTNYYENKWTAKGKPWVLYLSIECDTKAQALQIEGHIKKMKSRKYIENLTRYEEIIARLKEKYS